MSSLELLKEQIENINKRINTMEKDISEKKNYINKITKDKENIDKLLEMETTLYDRLVHNHKYLNEVKENTMDNYNQIQESANTLLDILKNKCDGI
jgi:hypothetical protein